MLSLSRSLSLSFSPSFSLLSLAFFSLFFISFAWVRNIVACGGTILQIRSSEFVCLQIGTVKCVYLDRASFNRLLGPCEEIMKRNVRNYEKEERKVMSRVSADSGATQRSVSEQLTRSDSDEMEDAATNMEPVEEEGTQLVARGAVRDRRRGICAEPVSEMEKLGALHSLSSFLCRFLLSSSPFFFLVLGELLFIQWPALLIVRAVFGYFLSSFLIIMPLLDWQKVVIPKAPEMQKAIRDSICNNLLFQCLDTEQMSIVVDAMFEKTYNASDFIIRQGLCFLSSASLSFCYGFGLSSNSRTSLASLQQGKVAICSIYCTKACVSASSKRSVAGMWCFATVANRTRVFTG